MTPHQSSNEEPVIRNVNDFNRMSGSFTERMFFNNRLVVVAVALLVTIVLGFQARHLELQAAFEKMLPVKHAYIANYLANKAQLTGLGNTLRIAVETTQGTIFDAGYLEIVRKINDRMFLQPGVDRPYMKSLWTPAVRWTWVTEEGLDGGPVIPDDYNGSPESIEQVRLNVERSGEIGLLVAPSFTSSIIVVPLQDKVEETGRTIDYLTLSTSLEELRAEYEKENIKIHITGFAKVVGDLIAGLQQVLGFFAVAIAICTVVLYWYTRCVRSTFLVVCPANNGT